MSQQLRMTLASALATLLAACSLSPLFTTWGAWLGPAVVAVALAAGIGSVARMTRVPWLVTAVAAPVALAVLVTALYARSTAWGGLVPTSATGRALLDLTRAALTDIKALAPPVEPRHGILLVTVTGVFVSAVLTDAIAVTARRAAASGLSLLMLFAVPAGIVRHGLGPWVFLLGASGWLLLLLVEGSERVGAWGHALGSRRAAGKGDVASASPVAAAGRRIGAAALGIAVVVPLAIPPLHSGFLHRSGGPGTGDGGPSSATVFPPIVTLAQRLHSADTVELLRVRTDNPQYLRMTALDDFDGARFGFLEQRAGDSRKVDKGLPHVDALDALPTTAVHVDVRVSQKLAEPYLPLPYVPTSVAVKGDWRTAPFTYTVFSTRTNTRGLAYSADALIPSPAADVLRQGAGQGVPTELAVDLALPHLPQAVTALVRQVVGDARTPYDAVTRLQAFLRSDAFTYDLNTPELSPDDPLSDFLLTSRRGYCEQFASALTVMARSLGIPARVAIGFTQGARQDDGSYVITNHDAHAWPEVWFPTAGWVRFEPTPLANGNAVLPDYADTDPQATEGPGATEEPVASAEPTPTGSAAVPRQAQAPEGPSGSGPGVLPGPAGTAGALLWLAVLLAVSLVVVAPQATRSVTRRGRLRRAAASSQLDGQVDPLWLELVDTADDCGVALRSSASPRGTAARLRSGLVLPTGAALASLDRLVTARERSCYAAEPGPSTSGLADDLARVRAALLDSLDRWPRLRARWAPRSVLSRWSRLLSRGAADALDAVDRGVTAVERAPGSLARRATSR